ncbi:MAG TPA: MFS transporter [Actinomycetota bacterium]|nr:MFS transporter [Actinomycetota bacterium]
MVVPPEVRRNTVLLILAQTALFTSLGPVSQLGSLISFELTGDSALAGVPGAVFYLGVAAITYPAARLMDRMGRRPPLVGGYCIAAAGALLISLAVVSELLWLVLVALAIYAIGVGSGTLTRAAVVDMYPSSERGRVLGLAAAAGLVGAVLGPVVVSLGSRAADAFGGEPLAAPWLFLAAFFVLAAAGVARVRPDPRHVAMDLARYYPGSAAVPDAAAQSDDAPSVRAVLSSAPARAAIAAAACSQGAMAVIMSTASLVLVFHGHGIHTISTLTAAHYVGMYGTSLVFGRLVDRVGRVPFLLAGIATVALSSMLFVLSLDDVVPTAATFFLIGLGWSLSFVSGSALLGDVAPVAVRARVFAVNDASVYTSAVVAALLAGPVLDLVGERYLGALAAIVALLPLVVLVRVLPSRIAAREPAVEAPGAVGGRGS